MYEITVKGHFDAAHYLREYGGRCENLHGHRWEVTVTLASRVLTSTGLAFDFVQLKKALKQVIGRFDHVCLDEVPPFDRINPSTENIARTVFQGMREAIGQGDAWVKCVTVWESPDSWCTYYED